MEVINLDSVDLNLENSSSFKLNDGDGGSQPASSLTGIELLMNNNKRKDAENPKDDNIHLDDIQSLERELNDLTDSDGPKIKLSENPIKLNIEDKMDTVNSVGASNLENTESTKPKINGPTISKIGEPEKTWDGYQQFNNIPLDPDKNVKKEPQLSREELLREKFSYLRKLEALEKKGIRLSKQYTMESSLQEMIGEYETIKTEKERGNSVKFQGRMLMAAVTGLEFLNNRFDPFDFKLDGWSEQVNENIDDYDEIFGELHEKYSSKAKMAPELKLLFQLSGSAIMLHMTNTMFKSSMPGMDDILKQNPELMQQFTQAAVNQMSDQRPGFGNFMNGMMDQQQQRSAAPPPPPMNQGPPPEPAKTRNPGRMDNFTRPDIGFGRGGPEEGVNIRDAFDKAEKPERSVRRPRPEMKGPSSDIDQLLSGLKTKTVNVNEGTGKSPFADSQAPRKKKSPTNAPKSKRRQISEKNTVSLDI